MKNNFVRFFGIFALIFTLSSLFGCEILNNSHRHSYGEWELIEGNSCEEFIYERTCSECGSTEEKLGSEADHVWGDAVNYHGLCGGSDYKELSCKMCGKVVRFDEILNPAEHTFGEIEVITSATCTADGEGKQTCLNCDTTVYVTIPARHIAAGIDATATQHYNSCLLCGKSFDKEDHSFVDSVCKVCGYEYRGESPKGEYNITVWVSELTGVSELFYEQIKRFEAMYPGLKINATVIGVAEADVGALVVADMASAPDLFCFNQMDLFKLSGSGMLSMPSLDVAKMLKENHDTATINAASNRSDSPSALYAYPLSNNDGCYMYYDKSIITNPDSLEQIIADVEAYNEANPLNPKYIRFQLSNAWYSAAFFHATGCYSNWVSDKNGDFYDVEDSYNSDEGIIAMKGMQKLLNSSAYNSNYGVMNDSAVIVTGLWSAWSAEKHFGENLGAADLPSFTVDGVSYHLGSYGGSKLLGVNSLANKNKRELLHLLAQYLVDTECQLERFENFNWVPSNLEAQQSEKVQSSVHVKAFIMQSDYAEPQRPVHDNWWVIAGGLAEKAMFANTDEDIKRALNSYEGEITDLIQISESESWSVIGDIMGTLWDQDFFLKFKGSNVYESDTLALYQGQEFKIRKGKNWAVNFGPEGYNSVTNFVVEESGNYVVRITVISDSEIVVQLIPVINISLK